MYHFLSLYLWFSGAHSNLLSNIVGPKGTEMDKKGGPVAAQKQDGGESASSEHTDRRCSVGMIRSLVGIRNVWGLEWTEQERGTRSCEVLHFHCILKTYGAIERF